MALVSLALGFTFACSSDADGEVEAAGERSTSAAVAKDTSDDSADTAVDDEQIASDEGERTGPLPSPILQYVGLQPASGSPWSIRADDPVGRCMAEEGFEWFPPAEAADEELGETELHELHLQDESWVSVYGFGISTLVFHQDVVGPDLVGMDDERSDLFWGRSPDEPDEASDPNEEYLATLSDEALERYRAALSECSEEAVASMGLSPRHEAFLEEFGDVFMVLFEEAQASLPTPVPDGDMLACLADARHEFDSYEAMTDSIRARAQELSFEVFNPNGPDDGPESEAAPQWTGEPLTEEQQARLADIQTTEVDMALAALACDTIPVSNDQAVEQAFYDLQVQYVEDNADELDAFLAAHPAEE